MKHLNKWLLPLVCVTMLLSSCKEDDYDVEPLLIVEKSEVNFAKNASSETISIEINKEDQAFVTVSPSARNWVTATINDDNTMIEISVTDNETKLDRSGDITVTIHKGNDYQTISVNQSGELDVILSLDKVYTNAPGQSEIEVFVEGNYTGEFTVSTTSDWLAITEGYGNGKFFFDILENESHDKRIGTIDVLVDGIELTLSVTQEGVFLFQLPYLEIGYDYTKNYWKNPNNLTDVFAFEAARGNTYVRSAQNAVHQFSTISPLVTMIVYTTEQSSFNIKSVNYEPITEKLLENADFMNYMESEGFVTFHTCDEYTTTTAYFAMWNKEKMIAMLYCPFYNRMTFHHTRYRLHPPTEEQVIDLATFNEFPWPYVGFGKKLNEIQQWEAAKGSTPLDKGPSVWTFTPQGEEHDPLERAYVFDQDTAELKYSLVLFENLEYGMYPIMNLNSIYYLATKEIRALLAEEGFEPYGYGNDMESFVNYAKGILVEVRVQGFESEGHLPRLVLYYKPFEA